MVKVDKLNFGSIIIDSKKFSRDVLIFSDGTVKKRKGGILMFGSHNIKKAEIEKLAQGNPEAIIVGIGTNAKAHLASGMENWAGEKNLSLRVQPSYEAVAKLNELVDQGKKVAALIHITC